MYSSIDRCGEREGQRPSVPSKRIHSLMQGAQGIIHLSLKSEKREASEIGLVIEVFNCRTIILEVSRVGGDVSA